MNEQINARTSEWITERTSGPRLINEQMNERTEPKGRTDIFKEQIKEPADRDERMNGHGWVDGRNNYFIIACRRACNWQHDK